MEGQTSVAKLIWHNAKDVSMNVISVETSIYKARFADSEF